MTTKPKTIETPRRSAEARDGKSDVPAQKDAQAAELAVLRRSYDKLTEDEFGAFVLYCRRMDLDPVLKTVVPLVKVSRKDGTRRVAYVTTIDGYRSIAIKTGAYEGQTPMQWCGKDEVWKDVWLDQAPPEAARVAVLRTSFQQPLYAVATLRSYKPEYDQSGNWSRMPDVMLGKCAEALALRKAFPQQFSGLLSDVEMEQSDFQVPGVQPQEHEQDAPAAKLRACLEAYGMPEEALAQYTRGLKIDEISASKIQEIVAVLEPKIAAGQKWAPPAPKPEDKPADPPKEPIKVTLEKPNYVAAGPSAAVKDNTSVMLKYRAMIDKAADGDALAAVFDEAGRDETMTPAVMNILRSYGRTAQKMMPAAAAA